MDIPRFLNKQISRDNSEATIPKEYYIKALLIP